jgi:hypothetical protein
MAWIQAWYTTHCDGDWEHDERIMIGTIDNPGWSVRVNFESTPIEGRPFERREDHRTETDWVVAWVEGTTFHVACGPLNLSEALETFRGFAQGSPTD